LQNKNKYTSHEYVKLHAAIEIQHRSIISFHFTRTRVHEATQLEPLLEPLYELGNVYADSGYLSANNCWVILMKGGKPFIKPKKTTTGETSQARPFIEMIQQYKENKKEWMKKYNQRSLIESVFSSLKRRLKGYVTSIKRKIQHTEIALKIIIYNLMILAKKRIEDEYF
jgi:transposase